LDKVFPHLRHLEEALTLLVLLIVQDGLHRALDAVRLALAAGLAAAAVELVEWNVFEWTQFGCVLRIVDGHAVGHFHVLLLVQPQHLDQNTQGDYRNQNHDDNHLVSPEFIECVSNVLPFDICRLVVGCLDNLRFTVVFVPPEALGISAATTSEVGLQPFAILIHVLEVQ